MDSALLHAGRAYLQNFRPKQRERDHRAAVGGLWDEIGQLQLRFMREQGLRPHHRLLDIGCGSLRAGRLFIRYLERGRYLGFDIDGPLVQAGLREEVGEEITKEKRPAFCFNDYFGFHFNQCPDFAIAQSLFTHLRSEQIVLCFDHLRHYAPACRLYATFNETPMPLPYFAFAPHTQRTFYYTRDQLDRMARDAGWSMTYFGDWGHPRRQKMALFRKQ